MLFIITTITTITITPAADAASRGCSSDRLCLLLYDVYNEIYYTMICTELIAFVRIPCVYLYLSISLSLYIYIYT